ncbi:MAG: hypothetical protein E7073_06775 [Bacteroidales bacterium]|nr:hypothetical protein [Bacteroidales bacterium]
MKKEDKELLLRDLCARLPYGVKVYGNYKYNNGDEIVDDIKIEVLDLSDLDWLVNGLDLNPYLRPMSSMTEEEVAEFESITEELLEHGTSEEIWDTVIDWLNAHHFDHRHLIEKGLAIEAPKDMYNEIKEEKK